MSGVRHTLVTGAPFESVFEVGMLLNEHPQALLGIERYSRLPGVVDQFLLTPERLVTPLSVETDVRGELFYARMRRRIDAGQLEVAGDLGPGYARTPPSIGARLGGPLVVVVLGAPAADELDQWRAAASLARDTEQRWFARRLFVFPYREFLAGERRWLGALLAFLGLPPTDRIDDAYARLLAAAEAPRKLGSEPDEAELREWFRSRARGELERYGGERPGVVRLNDPVLTADERAARERERDQLLAQRRAGSEWPDEREALARRHRQQAQEIHARGASVIRFGLSAARGLPSTSLRVGLISPRPTLSQLGREQAITRLAGHLSQLCTVRLFATEPPPPQGPGVDVRVVSTLNAELWAECDVVIYPGDMPGGALLEGGRAIMLLDGFEGPSDDVVLANLDGAREVFAASRWLCDLAAEHGAPAIHNPIALDASQFHAGPPQPERNLHVTGVAQTAEHLLCDDLSEAMVLVRERRPEVEVTLIGGVPADGATRFLRHPPLRLLADALRTSAVHVTSARAEGFGFVGAAALACGAALVTTDNPGSRDYAVHERTALVSPVGDPLALAENLLALLDDPDRRARLASDGGRHIRSLLPSWPDYARSLAVRLTEQW